MEERLKILWIDDEIALLRPLVMFLEKKGYHVEMAANGLDGIAKVESENIDLVLLDEMMPGLDGLETLERINAIKPNLPIIMCTKSEEEGIMEKAISNKIADYLIKPINPNQIILAIKKIFETGTLVQNQTVRQYTKFVNDINNKIYEGPTYDEWCDMYKQMCDWDIKISEFNDTSLLNTHFLQMKDWNGEFAHFISQNYEEWISSDERPDLSFDVIANHVAPLMEENHVPTYLIILDCLRLDQYLAIQDLIKDYFDINLNLYYSILPTATPYSRNAIFSGLLPVDIAERFPEYWSESSDMDNSRNRNEHQLMDELLIDLGVEPKIPTKYVKIFNIEEGNFVIRKIDSWKNDELIVLVYNFLDLLTHHRSKDQILLEAIPDEKALRNFTRHWFEHSTLFEALKLISKQGANVVITTDHGSIRVNRATQVLGDRDTTQTVRYKDGKNLSANPKQTFFIKNPKNVGLPVRNIVENYIFATDDYFFVYPNSFHTYQKKFTGTFQHGGVSMQEMILPCAIGKSKLK